jgi:hypothetical protein
MRAAAVLIFLACLACSSPAPAGGGYVGGFVLPNDGGNQPVDVSAAACTPGMTQLCLCAPKVEGVQVCRDDGKGWRACACEGQDAGATDSDAKGGKDGGGGDAQAADGGSDEDAIPDGGTVADGSGDPDGSDDAGLDPDGEEQDWSGYFDDATADTGTPKDTGTTGPTDCIARAKIIYVVTEENVLLSFDPDTLKLKTVGTLNCPAAPGATPFSMAVDRNAVAWVLYRPPMFGGGSIFQVSTLDATCKATSFQPGQNGLELFGMGFSADGPGNINESLFIAGASYSNFQYTANTLASVAFPSLQVNTVGKMNVVGGADLTGNGLGQLFGFFPTTSPPSVREIDKSSGVTGKVWPLPASAFSGTQAWAFAQWGGTFYLFFRSGSDSSTTVWALDSKTGGVKIVLPKIGLTVVGAGVSSCAPSSKP